MNKKILAVIIIITVLLLAALFVYYDHKLIDNMVQTGQEQQTAEGLGPEGEVDSGGTGDTGNSNNTDGASDTGETGETTPATSPAGIGADASGRLTGPEALLSEEAVDVRYDTPEYDLKLSLCENQDKKTFIRMEYNLNGTRRSNELDEGSLPELAGLFGKRAETPGWEGGYGISQALLNPIFGQLYILINDVPPGEYMQSSFYLIDLADLSVKKLFYYPGRYGRMEFNGNFNLLAYSFGDPPVLSVHQEDNLIEVFDCKNVEYLVKGNLYMPDRRNIGKNSSNSVLYDYWFEGWNSPNVLKLKMGRRPLSAPDTKPVISGVLYDISKNLLLDSNGSELKPEAAVENTAESSVSTDTVGESSVSTSVSGVMGENSASTSISEDTGGAMGEVSDSAIKPTDSEPLKTLKSFYSYLNSEKTYNNAMELLDDGFTLRLGMLEQFGVTEINKDDIFSEYNEDNINLYSELLKAANFDTIAKENTKGNLSAITYYQVMNLGADTAGRQYLSAQLKLMDGKWKITLIEDGVG
ncbi:MAG TPA: hypothetical protein VHT96_14850 [Clostridia bacterium]|nr:hypothetical protein [Clostridia bacterium]